ncbi:MAG: tRNA epoxyqueuosine(34) reductase QueG [Candidatus Zixiibacteriota bacterium]|nr:MAG: tRNA epoxyqueuosine(34) reductase QueG [candidate division Zixibacteria bacterium]
MMELKQFIKEEGSRLGFLKTGVAAAEYDPVHHDKLLNWIKNRYHASMGYLERETRKRFDPRIHLPDASSVIVCGHNYYTDPTNDPESGYVSIYARGEDYRIVLEEKLKELCGRIANKYGKFNFRIFVDTSPISEKTLAVKAGLGFIGRNSLVIIPKFKINGSIYKGSFHFLGVIVTDLRLEPDEPVKGTCGKCRRCIDSCPTGAILEDCTIDAIKCISYHTTSNRGEIPEDIAAKMNNIVIGCDICQLTCPYNNKPVETSDTRFIAKDFLSKFDIGAFLNMTEQQFNRQFRDTVLYDKGFEKIRAHALIVSRNIGR